MKIEKIHLNKIKVTFTPDDLAEHNLTFSAVRDNSPVVQNVLMGIVRQAEQEVGFTSEGERLMVEAMPAEGDCMVMYITRLGAEEDIKDVLNDVKRRIRLKVKQANETPKSLLITFDCFEDVLSLASFAEDFDGGELYFYRGAYHLIVPGGICDRFSEFGKITGDEKACSMVCEHGKKICSDALGHLRKYF
ncbi:MAG: adaptor protein MecA [Clostridia bacterium]|nr:adaptor protein MecA [Clostridia bacterium]